MVEARKSALLSQALVAQRLGATGPADRAAFGGLDAAGGRTGAGGRGRPVGALYGAGGGLARHCGGRHGSVGALALHAGARARRERERERRSAPASGARVRGECDRVG